MANGLGSTTLPFQNVKLSLKLKFMQILVPPHRAHKLCKPSWGKETIKYKPWDIYLHYSVIYIYITVSCIKVQDTFLYICIKCITTIKEEVVCCKKWTSRNAEKILLEKDEGSCALQKVDHCSLDCALI